MIAQKEPLMEEAIDAAYKLMLDKQEYYRMEAREDTLIHERVMKQRLEEAEKGREAAEKKLKELAEENERLKRLLEEKNS